jgi:hypothetical protein
MANKAALEVPQRSRRLGPRSPPLALEVDPDLLPGNEMATIARRLEA